MASRDQETGIQSAPGPVGKSESWAVLTIDNLRNDIRRLSLDRADAYVRAGVHRRDGHLVPASLCEELAHNASQLRCALDRYSEVTGSSSPTP